MSTQDTNPTTQNLFQIKVADFLQRESSRNEDSQKQTIDVAVMIARSKFGQPFHTDIVEWCGQTGSFADDSDGKKAGALRDRFLSWDSHYQGTKKAFDGLDKKQRTTPKGQKYQREITTKRNSLNRLFTATAGILALSEKYGLDLKAIQTKDKATKRYNVMSHTENGCIITDAEHTQHAHPLKDLIDAAPKPAGKGADDTNNAAFDKILLSKASLAECLIRIQQIVANNVQLAQLSDTVTDTGNDAVALWAIHEHIENCFRGADPDLVDKLADQLETQKLEKMANESA